MERLRYAAVFFFTLPANIYLYIAYLYPRKENIQPIK